MAKGKLALVLHAHLPYVRSAESGSLEEDWFFQALLECYLPLLETLERAYKTKKQSPKITISLSPTLLSLLEDEELKKRFPVWLKLRADLLTETPKPLQQASDFLKCHIKNQLESWTLCNGDLISRFASLQKTKVADLLTCAATHGYLPLLRENPEAVRGQLKTAVREYHRIFGIRPKGIWLPECAYYEGLDELMRESQLRYSILDGHGLLQAKPRPRYGIYAPICTKNGVAFFGRDSESTLPVWSSRDGYPGDPSYREFHRDLGWDVPIERLKPLGLKDPRPLGLKLHRITSQNKKLEEKEIYEPYQAIKKAKEDASHYLDGRKKQLENLSTATDINTPLLVAPFDAELFGHWWFEGPAFLTELFHQANQKGLELTTLKEYLESLPVLQLCEPSPSSWGQGGFHKYWLNETNAWIVPEWNKASKAMIDVCTHGVSKESEIRILQQAARELLLSQSSDWSFILRAGTTTELARERIERHLSRFWALIKFLNNDNKKYSFNLKDIETEDCLFPLIRANDWNKSQKECT